MATNRAVSKMQLTGIALDNNLDKKLTNEQLVIGNKVIKSRKKDGIVYLSIYKDLFLRLVKEDNEEIFISLSTYRKINKLKNVSADDIVTYLMTNGISLPFTTGATLYEKENEEPILYNEIINIESLNQFGFKENKLDYNKAIRLLSKINRKLQPRIKSNLRDHYFKLPSEVKEGFLKLHVDNMKEQNDLITKDKVLGLELTNTFKK